MDAYLKTNLGVYFFVILLIGFFITIGIIIQKYGKNIYYTTSYLIFAILFLIIFSIIFCKKSKKSLYDLKDHHYKLYDLMDYFNKFCLKYDITYWIIGGTALGSTRNNSIIPHDDDMDVGMLQKDLDKFISLEKEFNKDNYKTFYKNSIIQFCKKDDVSLCIDLFCFIKTDNKYIYKEKLYQIDYPSEWFYEHELFPLKKYKFGENIISGPNDIKKYLDRSYGNWKKIKINYPHLPTFKSLMLVVYNRLNIFP